MNLSKHVTLAEFEASSVATNHSIINKMNEFEIERAKLLCEKVFEPLREHLGEPIRINSGFRNIATNRAAGGSKTSQHCLGEAMDLHVGSKAFHYNGILLSDVLLPNDSIIDNHWKGIN